jgi:hypothetical protein
MHLRPLLLWFELRNFFVFGSSIRSTIDRYKKVSSDSSNTASITEINAQVCFLFLLYSNLYQFFQVLEFLLNSFPDLLFSCIKWMKYSIINKNQQRCVNKFSCYRILTGTICTVQIYIINWFSFCNKKLKVNFLRS